MPYSALEQIKNLILRDAEEPKLLKMSQAVECAPPKKQTGTGA